MKLKYCHNFLIIVFAAITVSALSLMFFKAGNEIEVRPDFKTERTQTDPGKTFQNIPLYFEPNVGQTDEDSLFITKGNGYEMRFSGDKAVLSLAEKKPFNKDNLGESPPTATLEMRLADSNKFPLVKGENENIGKVNYLTGDEKSKWLKDIPTYGKIRYSDVYEGVDLVYYGRQTQLEFDFIVAPGSDPDQIRMNFAGAKKIIKNSDGELVLSIGNDAVTLQKPILYQTDERGERQEIAGEFALISKDSVKFEIGKYDTAKQLIIDPILSYSTFLPGANIGYDIAVDNDGNAIVTGHSFGNVPTTDGRNTGGVFVTKFNPQGSSLIFSTRIGGSAGRETGRAVKIDGGGNIIVAGSTSSNDFPAVNPVKINSPFYVSSNGGDSWSNNNNFPFYPISRVAPSFQDENLLYAAAGSRVYRSEDGGGSWSNVTGNLPNSSSIITIAVNPSDSDQIYAVPAQNGLYRSNNKGVSWTQISGAILPGGGIFDIAFDPVNSQIIYLASSGRIRKSIDGGATWTGYNAGFPSNIFLTTLAIDPQKPSIIYAGTNLKGVYKSVDGGINWTAINNGISGNNTEIIRKLAIDPNNPATLYAAAGNYAGKNYVFKTVNGGANWSLIYTSPTGTNNEIGAITVSRTNSSRIYLGLQRGGFFRSDDGGTTWNRAQNGMWSSSIYSIVESPFAADKIYVGTAQDTTSDDAFVFKLNPSGNSLVYSTTLGGSDYEYAYGLAVDAQGGAYVGGTTKSFNFPTVNAVQSRHTSENADYVWEEGFVTKIAPGGGAIVYSTYLGGGSYDIINGLSVNAAGSLAVTGQTQSADFPTRNALQPNLRGIDAFLTKLSAAGNSIEFSTFWGTTGEDRGNSVKFDGDGNIIMVGSASATGLPTQNALQPDFKGNSDGFISKFSADGSRIIFSTYFGGKENDRIQDVDLDRNGNIYIAGTSKSNDFPQLRSVKSRSPYYRSSSGGTKWSNLNTNIFSEIYDFAFHPTKPLVIFAASDGGIIKTADGGDTWSKVGSVPAAQGYRSIEFDPQNPDTIYIGYRETSGTNPVKLAVSRNAGETWSILSGFVVGSGIDYVSKIVVSPANPQIIFAVTFYAVYKSTDGGTNWQKITSFAEQFIQDFAVNPADPSILFIAQAYSNGGILRSTDGGATWQKLTNGINGEYAGFVVIDPNQPSTIYAQTSGGIFKSVDGGDSWTLKNFPGGANMLIVDPFLSSTLYTTRNLGGNVFGIYRSVDSGATWNLYNEGLPGESFFRRVEADPRVRNTLHAVVNTSPSANDDLFVSKLNSSGTNLIYSTVLGGDLHTGNAFQDVAFGVAVTPNGSAFVTGGTTSPDFQITPNAYFKNHNNTILFAARFDPSWMVKGRITDAQTGESIPDVNLTLNGSRILKTETDGFGKYIFSNVAEGDNFTLVLSKLGYDFTPPNYSITSLNKDEVLNFTGVYTTYTITGQIIFQQNPLANVTVTLNGSQTGTATTDNNGNFSFTVPKYGDYEVRPALSGYIFAPQKVAFNNLTNNAKADFTARRGFTISGQILRNELPEIGVQVNLSGSENQTTRTDANGRYSFEAGANGNYQITPISETLGFLPPSRSISNLDANQNKDFAAYRLAYSVSDLTFARANSPTESQTEIFNIEDDGFNLERLTSTPNVSEGQPSWSPNGRKIAFTQSPTSSSQLFVMDFDGKNRQNISGNLLVSSPDWSPDSSKIVFSSTNGSVNNIYTVNSDGSSLKQITNDSVSSHSPNWSPDGIKIAFVRHGKIFTMKTDGSDLQRLTDSSLNENDPDWSPNGNEIVFSGSVGSVSKIYIVGVDGKNLRLLTSGEDYGEIQPAWSLDGTRIAYLKSNNIFVINTDGSNPKQITDDNLNKYNPVWKPRLVSSSIADFDGDTRTDISIFRPAPGEWWYARSSDGGSRAFQFGTSTDKIIPADYTGDGKTDPAFFRPSNSEWFILRSEDNSFYSFPFGAFGDIPAPGDFDGDGIDDPAVFRPSGATWYILKSSGGTIIRQFGSAEDVPQIGDYDGDGRADLAIFRPSNGQWWINISSTGKTIVYNFGTNTDKPVPADYTGDGKTDIAFWKPATGEWFVLRSEDASFYSFPFGAAGDQPTPGDYDGDGRTDPAVFRDSNTTWYLLNSTSGSTAVGFGANGDKPIPSAYIP